MKQPDAVATNPLPRIEAQLSGETPIVCRPVFEEICVNANGDIVCSSCDVAGNRIYGNVFRDRIADVYNGPKYQEIRDWLLRSKPSSWCLAITRHCPRRVTPAAAGDTSLGCVVKTLKLEPVTYCNLQCPLCPVEVGFKTDPHLRETRARKLLPLETMLDVVEQLHDLEFIYYYNFGEPLLHKDTVEFLRSVKRQRPHIKIFTNTNGVVITPTQIEAIASEALFDRMIFSIDGAYQKSYGKYRVGGDLNKALGKMSKLVEACRAADTFIFEGLSRGKVQITWQYILFDWNDSEKEMALARELASEIGIPIDWVITCGEGASRRFLQGSEETRTLTGLSPAFVSPTAPASLAENWAINPRAFDVFQSVNLSCILEGIPFLGGHYSTSWSGGSVTLHGPIGAVLLFRISIRNRTGNTWDSNRRDFLRIGCRLYSENRTLIRELPGTILPPELGMIGGSAEVAVRAHLPHEPGRYLLLFDVVQEWVCWFSEMGAQPTECEISLH